MNIKNYRMMRKLSGPRRMSAAKFWSECGIKVINYLCAVIIMVMVCSVTLQVSTERLTRIVEILAFVLAALWCIPILRNTRYRLRDAGFTAKSYLWLLLPFVGWLIFVVLLCFKSAPEKAKEDAGYSAM